MNRPNFINGLDRPQQIVLADDTRNIDNQTADSPRVSDSNKKGDTLFNATLSIFRRECTNLAIIILPGELTFNILFYCSLGTMLEFRLVSHAFSDLISYRNEEDFPCSLLMRRAAVSFKYNEIPVIGELVKKIDFANEEKLEIIIKISGNQLIQASQSLALINQEQLKISVSIQTLNEVNNLQAFFSNQPDAPFNHKIKKLDLSALKINNDTVASIIVLLNTIAQNSESFPSLSTLIMGDIEKGTEFDLSNVKTMDSVRIVTIGKIAYDANVTLSNAFSNLVDLSIGGIGENSAIFTLFSSSSEPLKFPVSLRRLVNFKMGAVPNGVSLKLPEMHQLVTLSMPIIGKHAIIDFTSIFPSLENFKIGCVPDGGFLKLLEMNRLVSLSIGAIGEKAKVNFPVSLPSLQNFQIGAVPNGVFLKLPEMKNLLSFSIDAIAELTNISFPPKIDNLLSFSINGRKENLLPTSFNDDSLSIERIENNSQINSAKTVLLKNIAKPFLTFNLSASLKNITCLNIWDIGCNIDLEISPPLESLTIKNILSNNKVRLLGRCDTLQSLTVGLVGKNAKLTLPDSKSLPKLVNLKVLNGLSALDTCMLPVGIPHLTIPAENLKDISEEMANSVSSLSLIKFDECSQEGLNACTKQQFQSLSYLSIEGNGKEGGKSKQFIFPTMPKLKNFSMKTMQGVDFVFKGQLPNLEGFSFKSIFSGSINFLDSQTPNITQFSIKRLKNVKIDLPELMPSLTTFYIKELIENDRHNSFQFTKHAPNLVNFTINKRQALHIKLMPPFIFKNIDDDDEKSDELLLAINERLGLIKK